MNCQSRFCRGQDANLIARRWFLQQCGVGLGSMALASLLGADKAFGGTKTPTVPHPLAPKQPHFKPKATRVIYLFMCGAPSQLDLFDDKPMLAKYNGQPVPKEVVMGQKYAFIKPDAALFASEFKFAKHGQHGAEPARLCGAQFRRRTQRRHGALRQRLFTDRLSRRAIPQKRRPGIVPL